MNKYAEIVVTVLRPQSANDRLWSQTPSDCFRPVAAVAVRPTAVARKIASQRLLSASGHSALENLDEVWRQVRMPVIGHWRVPAIDP